MSPRRCHEGKLLTKKRNFCSATVRKTALRPCGERIRVKTDSFPQPPISCLTLRRSSGTGRTLPATDACGHGKACAQESRRQAGAARARLKWGDQIGATGSRRPGAESGWMNLMASPGWDRPQIASLKAPSPDPRCVMTTASRPWRSAGGATSSSFGEDGEHQTIANTKRAPPETQPHLGFHLDRICARGWRELRRPGAAPLGGTRSLKVASGRPRIAPWEAQGTSRAIALPGLGVRLKISSNLILKSHSVRNGVSKDAPSGSGGVGEALRDAPIGAPRR